MAEPEPPEALARLRAENKQLGADVIEITDDDLLTILRRPLARADDDDWPTVTVDTMALRLALDAWDRAKTERDQLREEVDRLQTEIAWYAGRLNDPTTRGIADRLRRILEGHTYAHMTPPDIGDPQSLAVRVFRKAWGIPDGEPLTDSQRAMLDAVLRDEEGTPA